MKFVQRIPSLLGLTRTYCQFYIILSHAVIYLERTAGHPFLKICLLSWVPVPSFLLNVSRGCWLSLHTHWVKLSHPIVFYNLSSSFSLSELVDHTPLCWVSAETMESSLTLLLPIIFSQWTRPVFLLFCHLFLLPLAYFGPSSLFWEIRIAYQLAALLLAVGWSNLPCHLSSLPKHITTCQSTRKLLATPGVTEASVSKRAFIALHNPASVHLSNHLS